MAELSKDDISRLEKRLHNESLRIHDMEKIVNSIVNENLLKTLDEKVILNRKKELQNHHHFNQSKQHGSILHNPITKDKDEEITINGNTQKEVKNEQKISQKVRKGFNSPRGNRTAPQNKARNMTGHVSSRNSHQWIEEVGKPRPSFNRSKRFETKEEVTPGPGAYESFHSKFNTVHICHSVVHQQLSEEKTKELDSVIKKKGLNYERRPSVSSPLRRLPGKPKIDKEAPQNKGERNLIGDKKEEFNVITNSDMKDLINKSLTVNEDDIIMNLKRELEYTKRILRKTILENDQKVMALEGALLHEQRRLDEAGKLINSVHETGRLLKGEMKCLIEKTNRIDKRVSDNISQTVPKSDIKKSENNPVEEIQQGMGFVLNRVDALLDSIDPNGNDGPHSRKGSLNYINLDADKLNRVDHNGATLTENIHGERETKKEQENTNQLRMENIIEISNKNDENKNGTPTTKYSSPSSGKTYQSKKQTEKAVTSNFIITEQDSNGLKETMDPFLYKKIFSNCSETCSNCSLLQMLVPILEAHGIIMDTRKYDPIRQEFSQSPYLKSNEDQQPSTDLSNHTKDQDFQVQFDPRTIESNIVNTYRMIIDHFSAQKSVNTETFESDEKSKTILRTNSISKSMWLWFANLAGFPDFRLTHLKLEHAFEEALFAQTKLASGVSNKGSPNPNSVHKFTSKINCMGFQIAIAIATSYKFPNIDPKTTWCKVVTDYLKPFQNRITTKLGCYKSRINQELVTSPVLSLIRGQQKALLKVYNRYSLMKTFSTASNSIESSDDLMKSIIQARIMNFDQYLEWCNDYNITPSLISREDVLIMLKEIIWSTNQSYLSYGEFLESIILLAERSFSLSSGFSIDSRVTKEVSSNYINDQKWTQTGDDKWVPSFYGTSTHFKGSTITSQTADTTREKLEWFFCKIDKTGILFDFKLFSFTTNKITNVNIGKEDGKNSTFTFSPSAKEPKHSSNSAPSERISTNTNQVEGVSDSKVSMQGNRNQYYLPVRNAFLHTEQGEKIIKEEGWKSIW